MAIEIRDRKSQILNQKDVPADENVTFLRELMDKAGHITRGMGMECIGYSAVFYYRSKFSQEGEFRMHSELKMVTESFANDGAKALLIHMGKKYGRKPRTPLT